MMVDVEGQILAQAPERALFDGQVQGLAAVFYQNERPPCGLSGALDWHFKGLISQYLQSGAILGHVGECCYFPITRHQTTFHILLVGAGHSERPGNRQSIPPETFVALQKNLSSLRIPKIGISMADFGVTSPELLKKRLKGASVWITP